MPAAILVAAVLYSSVGHGGASAYLAVMSLAGLAPSVMRPAALVLNLIVAGISFVLPSLALRRLLAAVLVIAGGELLFG